VNASPGTLTPSRTESRDGAQRQRAGEARLTEDIPRHASGLELLGPLEGSGYRDPPSLVRRADGQTLQLTPLLYEVLSAIDGVRTSDEIAGVVSRRISREVTGEDIAFLIAEKLRPLGILRRADGSEPEVKKANPLLGLRLKKVVTDRAVTRRLTSPFAKLFHPVLALPFLIAFGATVGWVLLEKGLGSAAHQALYEPGVLLALFGLTMLSAAFHEVGHAAAATYGGAAPGAMGVGLYLVWPAFYTDVTDSYRLGRGGRLRVDLGGLYFNAIFAVAVLGAWTLVGWDALLLLIPAQLFHMLYQLLPFVRFDGYHILADLVGVPDLFARIKPTLLHLHPKNWGKLEAKVLRPWARLVVTLWVLAVVPILGFAFAMMVKVLPRVIATAWDSIGIRAELLTGNWANDAYAKAAVDALSIATIALPVLSMTYLAVRLLRRVAVRTWQATEGKPKLRALSIVAAIAALALLVWQWWPSGQYRPIEASERGTLFGSAPTAEAGDPVLASAATRLPMMPASASADARPQLVMVLSPEGVPVDSAGPKTVVPVSALGEGLSDETGELGTPAPEEASEWAFPFDPPSPPEEDGNQALAVNTEDGSTVYDVAFAVLWLTDEDVDAINEAWAVASCEDCQTVAVAFQAVFVVGESDVVVPQNRAVAINYNCDSCETAAISIQLVATLSDVPSEEAMEELQTLFDELAELEKNASGLPLQDVYDELRRIEQAMVEVLIEDGVLVVPLDEDGVEEPIDDVEPTPSEDGMDEEEVSAEDEVTTEETDETTLTEGSETSTEPTAEPTGEPVEEPTEDAEPEPTEEPAEEPSEETETEEEPSPEPTG
jgi:putative peptide zinc metalloprotease protein